MDSQGFVGNFQRSVTGGRSQPLPPLQNAPSASFQTWAAGDRGMSQMAIMSQNGFARPGMNCMVCPPGMNCGPNGEPINAEVPQGLFDAHAHLLDFFQHSEGIDELLECMDEVGVSHAALTGAPLKKNWSEFEERRAPDAFNDTDVMYYFSLTDMYLIDAVKNIPAASAARFYPLMCGFNPTDKSAVEQIEQLMDCGEIQWKGFGQIYLRSSELTNLTQTTTRATPLHQAFDFIMTTAGNRNVPVILSQNASSESTKAYKTAFEYIHEIDSCAKKHSNVKILWVHGGIFVRGDWDGYKDALAQILAQNSNLHISITPDVLAAGKLKHEELREVVETYPDRFMVGSSTMGVFCAKNVYSKEWKMLKTFLGGLARETQEKVGFANAFRFYRKMGGSGQRGMMAMESKVNWLRRGTTEYNEDLHDEDDAYAKDMAPPKEKNISLKGMKDGKLLTEGPQEVEHVVIDTHLHMLDFLQKSSGMPSIMQAMDGCGVEKAVLIGMPCCKKWSKDEPEKPLYYQDDNGQCYVYSYADQMVADAWLALPDDKRARFAPVMASFNPTDIAAIDHVRRMWDKYPGMWRGLGEVMCRHDDLTMLLQDNETPVINHTAMRGLFEFCIEKDIACMVHHNADRTAERERDNHYEYLWEVQQVLEEFPNLRLVWCHAGASRRTFEETHHRMLDELMSAFPNLIADISWCVWEDVICEGTGKPKKGWCELFEKHPTRFTIGSDQVGQFIGPAGHNWLKPEIVKYWKLFECVKKETAQAICYDNAHRIWFEGWKMPSGDGSDPKFTQIPPSMKCETLWVNTGKFANKDDARY